jgi:hypothetical protein
MTTLTFAVPAITQNDVVAASLVVAAILASVVFDAYKRHHNAKHDIDLAKHWVAIILTGLSAAFTYLAWLLTLAGNNQALLKGLPYVGKHVEAVVGIAWSIYMLKGNKVYQAAAEVLGKWSGAKKYQQAIAQPTVAPSTSEPTVDPSQYV